MTRRRILTAAITALVAIGAVGALAATEARATGTTTLQLSIPLMGQMKDKLCRAASSEMALYKVKGLNYSQCTIVNNALGVTDCRNNKATDGNVQNGLKKLGVTTSTVYSGLLPMTTIVSQIGDGLPILYHLSWVGSNDGHMVIITGFTYNPTSTAISTVYWNDPWPVGPGTRYSGTWSYLSSNQSWKAFSSIWKL